MQCMSENKNRKLKSNRLFFLFAFWGLMIISSLMMIAETKETLVLIADEKDFIYYKPEVALHPSGAVYIIYEAKNVTKGKREIYLSKYENDKVSFVKNISETTAYSCEPDICISQDGTIHCCWINQTGNYVTGRYRMFNGEQWSEVANLGTFGPVGFVEDFRLCVDEENNVYMVYSYFPNNRCRLISKYGNLIIPEDFPVPGRAKHSDVAVDNTTLWMSWQQVDNDAYNVVYSYRDRDPHSKWADPISLGHVLTTRPRIDFDPEGILHFIFSFKYSDSTRTMHYKQKVGDTFTKPEQIAPADGYHWADLAIVDTDNVIASMQIGSGEGGRGNSYNWKQNGNWTGNRMLPSSTSRPPSYQSVDLSREKMMAVIAYTERFDAVHLSILEESGQHGEKPTAAFVFSPHSGSTPLEVNFDASTSDDEDGNIRSYRWNFGDGLFGAGKTVSHSYYAEGSYTVTLTVYDDDFNSDSATGTVQVVNVLPPQSVTYAHYELRGFLYRQRQARVDWQANPGNAANGINVNTYKIYRKRPEETSYRFYIAVQAVSGQQNFTYFDLLTDDSPRYNYTVSSYDDQGRESNLPGSTDVSGVTSAVILQSPPNNNR